MAFWGIEVKPGRPVTHKFDQVRGRLHISQAALGLGSATNKSVVQCNIGDKCPVILCVLLPDKTESCHLDLQFEEADDTIFSVIGPRSVHLTGYFLHGRHLNHNDSSESYGVDIANSDSVHSVHDSEEDSYDDSFIDDDDPEVFSGSPRSMDMVADEEMSDKKKPKERKANHKRLKKRYKSIDSEDECNSELPYSSALENDAEDCAVISTLLKSKTTQAKEKLEKEMSETDDKNIENSESLLQTQNNSNGLEDEKILQLEDEAHEEKPTASRPKKRRKKANEGEHSEKATADIVLNQVKVNEDQGGAQNSCNDISMGKKVPNLPHHKNNDAASNPTVVEDQLKGKKSKKKKKNKTQGKEENEVIGVGPSPVSDKNVESNLAKARTLSNGLIIQDIEMGKPDGKVATSGKKVKVHYVGKLRDGGQVFDSNIGKSPLKFRLGAEGVTADWNIGLDGMRVGGKRRLTIPPKNGNGSPGAGENIPPNTWLVYDFELVGVR